MQIETRACRIEERDALLALVNLVFDDMGDMGAAFPLLFGPDNLQGLRVVLGCVAATPVAHVTSNVPPGTSHDMAASTIRRGSGACSSTSQHTTRSTG